MPISNEALQTKIEGEAAINRILINGELCFHSLYAEFGGSEKGSYPHLPPNSKAIAEIVFRAEASKDAEWAQQILYCVLNWFQTHPLYLHLP